MSEKQCKECGQAVAMRLLPQSHREFCPECKVVQSDWPERHEPMP